MQAWKTGHLTFGLTAVSGGSYQLAFSSSRIGGNPAAAVDPLAAWSGTSEAALAATPQSLQKYAGC